MYDYHGYSSSRLTKPWTYLRSWTNICLSKEDSARSPVKIGEENEVDIHKKLSPLAE